MSATARPVVVGIVAQKSGALRFAIDEARLTRSPLWVVHSVSMAVRASDVYADFDVIQEVNAAGQRVLDDAEALIQEVAPQLEVRYILASEAPLKALELASPTARLLVLGADDVPWFDRLLRTKVAGHLALHARCPVVVVPERIHLLPYEGDLILTLDGDTPADGPIHFAFEEASARDAVLHVLHATRSGSTELAAARANVAEVLAGWREKYPDVMIFEAVVPGAPETVVLRATESAGLVIVGRPHGHVVPFVGFSAVVTEVLRRAHCPVAVVPVSP